MFKKVLCILVVMALMVSVAACGGGKSGKMADGRYDLTDGRLRLSGYMIDVLFITIDGDDIVIYMEEVLGNNQKRQYTLEGNKFSVGETEYEIEKVSSTEFTIKGGTFTKVD